jgi:hypothetical protein
MGLSRRCGPSASMIGLAGATHPTLPWVHEVNGRLLGVRDSWGAGTAGKLGGRIGMIGDLRTPRTPGRRMGGAAGDSRGRGREALFAGYPAIPALPPYRSTQFPRNSQESQKSFPNGSACDLGTPPPPAGRRHACDGSDRSEEVGQLGMLGRLGRVKGGRKPDRRSGNSPSRPAPAVLRPVGPPETWWLPAAPSGSRRPSQSWRPVSVGPRKSRSATLYSQLCRELISRYRRDTRSPCIVKLLTFSYIAYRFELPEGLCGTTDV